MKIAVLSGKGGTGKTFISVNLAAVMGKSVYIDCDVEEPNGRIFLSPGECSCSEAVVPVPRFDLGKCSGCRKCVDFCHFNALVFIKKHPVLFSEVCHSCGGCMLVCTEKAITEVPRPVGVVEQGQYHDVTVVTGILDPGEASAVPVIKAALQRGLSLGNQTIIDCPPGSGCPVMESVMAADCCILVAEPTAFGFHNFKMVYELVKMLQKPCFVVVNKEDEPYFPLESFCAAERIPVLMHIPYQPQLARCIAAGKLVSEEDSQWGRQFRDLLIRIQKEAAR
ncbi:MAG: ATP-binding protein [Megasphaera sp.]|jgi:MinD superfamily P-loop ATPase|nr:ATP-binding protein [Megasphaera sp.]MCI1247397.1 ATP-binding protein [Megasphaera sp.]